MPNFLIEISFLNVLIVIKVEYKIEFKEKFPEQQNKTGIAITQWVGEKSKKKLGFGKDWNKKN